MTNRLASLSGYAERPRPGYRGHLVLMPPHRVWPAWTGSAPKDEEDFEKTYRMLTERGFRCERLDLNHVPVNPAGNSHPLYMAIDPVRALRLMLRRRGVDYVFCSFESAALVVLLFRRLLGFKGKVTVIDLGMPGWRPRNIILDLVVPRADAILPFTSAQARFVRERWPTAKLVIPVMSPIDCNFFVEAADEPDGPVLAVGDDGSRDYPTLLAAAPSIARTVRIRSKHVRADPARPNVEVVGKLPITAYRDMIAGASVVALPMTPVLNGGGTTALIEAMASGKAVVSTRSPAIIDYVEDGVSALLVPPGDPAAMAAAINRLLTDHALRIAIGKAARERAVQQNSFEAWAGALECVMEALDRAPD